MTSSSLKHWRWCHELLVWRWCHHVLFIISLLPLLTSTLPHLHTPSPPHSLTSPPHSHLHTSPSHSLTSVVMHGSTAAIVIIIVTITWMQTQHRIASYILPGSTTLRASLVPRPSAPPVFDRLLEAIKSWRCGRPGNDATKGSTVTPKPQTCTSGARPEIIMPGRCKTRNTE